MRWAAAAWLVLVVAYIPLASEAAVVLHVEIIAVAKGRMATRRAGAVVLRSVVPRCSGGDEETEAADASVQADAHFSGERPTGAP